MRKLFSFATILFWLALLCATCEGAHTVSPSPRLIKALPPRWRDSMCSTVARKP